MYVAFSFSPSELGPQQMVHFTWNSADSRRLLLLSCMGCDPVTISLHEVLPYCHTHMLIG